MIIRQCKRESADQRQILEMTLTQTSKGFVCELTLTRKTDLISDKITVSQFSKSYKRAYSKALKSIRGYAKL